MRLNVRRHPTLSRRTTILEDDDEYEDEAPANLLSGAPNPWTNRFIAPYSYQEALEEDGVAESLPNIRAGSR
jgi:hypothetical protein